MLVIRCGTFEGRCGCTCVYSRPPVAFGAHPGECWEHLNPHPGISRFIQHRWGSHNLLLFTSNNQGPEPITGRTLRQNWAGSEAVCCPEAATSGSSSQQSNYQQKMCILISPNDCIHQADGCVCHWQKFLGDLSSESAHNKTPCLWWELCASRVSSASGR